MPFKIESETITERIDEFVFGADIEKKLPLSNCTLLEIEIVPFLKSKSSLFRAYASAGRHPVP